MILTENPACNILCQACHYKDLAYPTQLTKKQAWAERQLAKWGNSLKEIIPAPETDRLAYRSKTWLRSSVNRGILSFGMFRAIQVEGEWEKEFLSWDTCPIHIQPIQDMIQKIKAAFTPEDLLTLQDTFRGIWIGIPHLVFVTHTQNFEIYQKLDWNHILIPPFNQAWVHCNPQVGKKIFSHHEIYPLTGLADSSDQPIRAFRQIARGLLLEARNLALNYLLQNSPELVVDLYCGTGDLSLMLPKTVGWIGIESSLQAVKYANTLRDSKITKHLAFVGNVEHRLNDAQVLQEISGRYSLYLNPPRSGLAQKARESIQSLIRKNRPLNIVYLSCSASSLSRDLEFLQTENYEVTLLQPYDFFPQTEHIETLAVLSRCHGDP